MPASTRPPRSRPHGAPAVIWCTRAGESRDAAGSVRTETPSARAGASCPGAFPLGLLQAPRRPGYPLQYRRSRRQAAIRSVIVTLTPLQGFSERDRPGGSVRRCYQHPG
jgi:hypothetical protein